MWKGCKYSSGFGLLRSAQLSVTEAYYRTRASAAGGQRGRRAGTTAGGSQPVSGCEAGGGWPRAPRTGWAAEPGRKEGRKGGAAQDLGRTWERCSLRLASPAALTVRPRRLLPVTAGRFQRTPLEPPACRRTCFLSPKLRGQSP